MFKKINDYFLVYKWRKIALISSLILALVQLLFLILWVISFLNYETKEIEFLSNQNVKSSEQKSLFLGLNILNIVLVAIIIGLSMFGIILISKDKNSGYLFLRITTYLTFVVIASLILLIAIKPQQAFQEVVAPNGFVSKQYLALPNYGLAWGSLIFAVYISLASALSRSNFGFLKKEFKFK